MRSNVFVTLATIGGGASLALLSAVGCGSSSKAASTTGTGGSTGTTTTTSTGTGVGGGGETTATSTTGTGGGSSSGHTPATATAIDEGSATQGTLVDAKTSDWYTFTGTAGDRLYLAAAATQLQTEQEGFDATVTQTTLVLLGSNMDTSTPLTYQAGEWPGFSQNSVLYVELPTTGSYYLGVQDCNALFTSGCPNPASGITSYDYTLYVAKTSSLTVPETLASSTNTGTTANAGAVTYKVDTGTDYYSNLIGGDFPAVTGATTGDTQVFSLTPPTGSAPTLPARGRAEFYVQPIGSFQGGDMSSSNVIVWATDSSGNIISQANQTNYPTSSTEYVPLQLSIPYTPGSQYYLYVQNATAGGGTGDFYFIDHYLNALIDQAQTTGNTTFAKAQALNGQGSAKTVYTIDGNIATTPSEVDWYSIGVPTGVTQYQIQCDSASTGSGLTGFTASLYTAATAATSPVGTPFATATEDPVKGILTTVATLPTGATSGNTIYMTASATGQSATVKGSQYRCFVFFQ